MNIKHYVVSTLIGMHQATCQVNPTVRKSEDVEMGSVIYWESQKTFQVSELALTM